MNEVTLLNERELLSLGISRPTIAALRNIQRVAGDINAPSVTELKADVDGITVDISTLEADLVTLQSEIDVLDATKEDVSNKVTSISAGSTNTQYPSAKLLYDQLAGKQPSGSYEVTTNKVTSWQSPTTDTNYPSEKLVRDTILPLEPATYYPSSMTVSAGTLDTGTYADLAALGGTDVNISEATGANPLTVVFGFTGVSKLSGFVFFGRYSGGAGHQMLIEAYNYTLASWDQLEIIGTDTTKRWYSFPIFSPADYMSGGAAQIRFSHVQNGINTHDMIFDLVALYFGALSGQSSISAASVVFTPTGNIAATNVASALMELDSEKQEVLVSGTNIKTINSSSILGSGDIVITGTGEMNVQADWNQSDNAQDDYIKNKPASLPASDVSAWAKAATKPSYTAAEVGALTYSQVLSLVSMRV